MTDLEKLEARLAAVETAIHVTQQSAVTDRKMSHDKHVSGHYTTALSELDRVKIGLVALIGRHRAVGR